ncbi:sensor domain-containing diguanylate cyclase [Niallia sp. XMNu-256]|uniref:sensor domain-containing diguanylate cyclase n=1 Tax=Niallia sp. XMNu-256 TaxID=3082444 RepID=UPI0030CB5AA1
METVEERLILNIKSQLYNIITKNSCPLQYEPTILEMLKVIQEILNFHEAGLCIFNDYKQELIIEVTTNPEFKLDGSELDRINYQSPSKFSLNANRYGWIIPIKQKESFQRFLILVGHDKNTYHLSLSFLVTLSQECLCFLEKLNFLINLISEQKRYKQLFRVTEKVHSTMNMESVLTEIIGSLREIYPDFTYDLLLSQDYKEHDGLPIKEFDYDSKNNALMEAYVTGTLQFENSSEEEKSILYAPLKGKQGVYGVLQINTTNSLVFPKNEVEFISLLAKTAGVAMENAQLYEQSKRLVADLQLINETSQRLNSSLRLKDTMQYMSEQIILSLGAEEVGFIGINPKNKDIKVHGGSTEFFFTDWSRPYIDFAKNRVIKDLDSIFIGEFKLPLTEGNSSVPVYKSIMVVPMLQANLLNGFVIVLHQDTYAFSFETFKLLKSLIHHSTLAFTNTILREELEKMVITDYLTRLYSRNYLDEKIKESMNLDAEGTFIMIDIDNFKVINDTYGHQIGDEVIIQVAEIIRANIRSTDIGARWGGEELAVYLPRVPLEIGVHIADRLVKKVRELSNPKITVSCGVSHWQSEDNDTYTSLFKRADQALYTAKETGKNKVVTQLKLLS